MLGRSRVSSDEIGVSGGCTVSRRRLGFTLGAALAASLAVAGGPPPLATAEPGSVTIAGSLQSELGCPGDWQPDCAATQLTFDAEDVVWQAVFPVPAGSWEYKAALDGTWDVNYGQHATPNGPNIGLVLADDDPVKFYFDDATHWVTDDHSSVIAVAPGSFQSELGCAGDWDPSCLRSWLQDPDGDGIHRFTSSSLPPGTYEFKVAIDETWDENYGADGAANGANISFTVGAPGDEVIISYNERNHQTRVSVVPAVSTVDDAALVAEPVRHPVVDEVLYFAIPDRFDDGNPANNCGFYTEVCTAHGTQEDVLTHGYLPSQKGYYHGGDLEGLREKLPYLDELGMTAIWVGPIFTNQPTQTDTTDLYGHSAGYHGYWITDFLNVDPHLGTNDEFRQLVDEAHGMGIKVFMDVVTNHTADVIQLVDNAGYRNKRDFPYTDTSGQPFDDSDYAYSGQADYTFPDVDETSFPYDPVVPDSPTKNPAWLNDPTLYHNRGNTSFTGENSLYGDFFGLDDLWTERREVVEGMVDIYSYWIEEFGVDGFRIDTTKHVNMEFWQVFGPDILQAAADAGIDDFFAFGEVFDQQFGSPFMSEFSTEGKLQSTIDFGFQVAARGFASQSAPTDDLRTFFESDDYYTDADSNAYAQPTFLGNHDMGRIGRFVGGSLARDQFAHALMYTLRGQPVIYYGDEQGFVGDGGDQDARQDMFPSQVASYNDDPIIGGPTGSRARYDKNATMYRYISGLSALRKAYPALADGAQTTRFASDAPGIFAVSRVDRHEQVEYVVVANNAETAKTATFSTYTPWTRFSRILGGPGGVFSSKRGQLTVTVPPLTVQVYRAHRKVPRSHFAPAVYFAKPSAGGVLANRAEIRAAVPANTPVQASFAFRPVGTTQWQPLGTDDNAPYRVFHDVSGMAKGTLIEYRTVVKDNAGHISASSTYGVVGDAPKPVGGGVGDVTQPASVSVPGTLNSEMGCAADWDPACPQDQLSLDPNDKIWKGTFTLPAGTYSYKVAINGTWDENYGAGGVQNGANIDLVSDGTPITFFYDHRTHLVSSTAQGHVVVAAGSFQSEMGCGADWDPACMRSWLQDPDGDGTYTLSTTQIPAGSYEVKAALDRSWDVNYGAGGVAGGANIPFTVPDVANVVTTFSFDSSSHVLTVTTAAPGAKPDLSVAAAYWLDQRTIAYPVDRLPSGTDPAWLRYRLHWGQLAVDGMSLGGAYADLRLVPGGPDGYVALRLDRWTARHRAAILAAPMVALGVYDDADQLLDGTGVRVS